MDSPKTIEELDYHDAAFDLAAMFLAFQRAYKTKPDTDTVQAYFDKTRPHAKSVISMSVHSSRMGESDRH